MIWKRAHRRRLPLLRAMDLRCLTLCWSEDVASGKCLIEKLKSGNFFVASSWALVSLPNGSWWGGYTRTTKATELVTIAQLENRLADSVRSAWLGVPSLFSDWFCSQELLVSIGDSLRRGCPLLDLDSSWLVCLPTGIHLMHTSLLRFTFRTWDLFWIFQKQSQLDSAMSSCSSQEISSGQVRGWLLNGEEADPFPWPLNGVN